MTWPTLPAFSANNFLDHFAGASLDATKWATATAGAGAVSVTDSYASIAMTNAGDAAFIYYSAKLDKTKSQLWLFAYDRESGNSGDYFYILDSATAPICDTNTNNNPKVRIQAFFNGSNAPPRFAYFDSSHTFTQWDGTSTNTWTSPPKNAYAGPMYNSDYYLLGFEIDGANARWRLLGYGQGYGTAGTYTYDQGLRLFALTDWVSWSSLEATSDLWLCLGRIYADINVGPTPPVELRYEWVRYAEQVGSTPLDAWCDHDTVVGGTDRIGHYWSYDGNVFVPETRTNTALDVGVAATWDASNVQEARVVYDGVSTDYMFYQGDSGGASEIGVAKATHVSSGPQNGPWTRGANNPILATTASETALYSPFVICDKTEPNANQRWKMLYAAKGTDGNIRIYGATAPDPPDTSTWTRQGLLLDLGATGNPDDTVVENPAAINYNGIWQVWYNGRKSNFQGPCSTLRATGTSLFSLTKDGTIYHQSQAAGETTISASLTGRTVSVASTSGFVQDGRVSLEVGNTGDNFATSRVRKVVNSTTLELYHGLTGFVNGSYIEQADASRSFNHRLMAQVGGSYWWMPYEVWAYWNAEGFQSYEQDLHLATINAADPTGAPITWQQLPGNIVPLGYNNDLRVARAMSILTPPFAVFTRTVPATAALQATLQRSIPTTAALQSTLTRSVPATTALQSTLTRAVPASAALQATLNRMVPTTVATEAMLSRAVPATTALQATLQRTVPGAVALQATLTRTVPSTAAIGSFLSRAIPASGALQTTASRAVPTSAALNASLTRSVPTTVATQATSQRLIPASAAVGTFLARTVATSAALQATNQRAIPCTVALVVSGPLPAATVRAQVRITTVTAVKRG